MPSPLPLISAALLMLAGCRSSSDSPAKPPPSAGGDAVAVSVSSSDLFEGYRLDRPDTVLRLPRELREVSGLAWGPTGALEANHDERGDAYRLVGGNWQRMARYAGQGDFEGIAYAGTHLYALRSDGQLVTPQGTVSLGTPQGCDGEGLAFDGRAGRLLIACKGHSAHTRGIYAWDLAARRLSPTPVISIVTNLGRTEGRMARLFRLDRLDRFRPSGVEVGPDGRIYVLSSQVQALAVFSRSGRLEAAAGLDRRLLPQPEGLTFGPDGTLYIASEAAEREYATLAVYKRVRPQPSRP